MASLRSGLRRRHSAGAVQSHPMMHRAGAGAKFCGRLLLLHAGQAQLHRATLRPQRYGRLGNDVGIPWIGMQPPLQALPGRIPQMLHNLLRGHRRRVSKKTSPAPIGAVRLVIMTNYEMRLERIELQNYRQFGVFETDFDKRLTVLCGDNGAGKTAVLDAVAVALGTFLMHVDGPNAHIVSPMLSKSDVRLQIGKAGSLSSYEPQTPTVVAVQGTVEGSCIRWSRKLNRLGGRTTVSEAKEASKISKRIQESIKTDVNAVLPLLAYYGTGRLWVHKRGMSGMPNVFEKRFSRANGYIDCLDSATNEKLMLGWFRRMTMVELQYGQQIPELVAVCQALSTCLKDLSPEYSDVAVAYSLKQNALVLKTVDKSGERSELLFDRLSDGYRGVLSLFADIAYRMAVLNPNSAEILSTPGIVLIDEVDLHLHPKWQSRILGDLLRIFPNLQFIVSTHAPKVISSVKASRVRRLERIDIAEPSEAIDWILMLERNSLKQSDLTGAYPSEWSYFFRGVEPKSELYGHSADSILEDVMGAQSRPEDVRELMDCFYRQLDEEDLEAAERTLEILENKVGTDDDSVVGARSALDTERWCAEN